MGIVNDVVEADDGGPFLLAAYGFPVDLDTVIERIPVRRIPCLAVHRISEKFVRRTMHKTERQVRFGIDILVEAPAPDELESFRALMHEAFHAIEDAVYEGVGLDSRRRAVLAAAGFTHADPDMAAGAIDWKPDNTRNRPLLASHVTLYHRDISRDDVSALYDLLSLDAKYVLQTDADATDTPLADVITAAALINPDVVPIVESITTLP